MEGKINASSAASKLNLWLRQVKRLKKKFKQWGYDCLIHPLPEKTGLRKIDKDIEDKVVLVIKERYYDFGPTMAWEKLSQFQAIRLSDETIRAIMIRNNIWYFKRRRSEYFCWHHRRSAHRELPQFDGRYHNWFEQRNPNVPQACLSASIDDTTGKLTKVVRDKNESEEAVFA